MFPQPYSLSVYLAYRRDDLLRQAASDRLARDIQPAPVHGKPLTFTRTMRQVVASVGRWRRLAWPASLRPEVSDAAVR